MGGRRLGLIIGNQGYDDPLLATLQAPRLDVELLATVLRDEAVGQFDEVEVLLDAPERDLRRAIAKFCANRTADDTLLLFFSGHGILDEEGLLHLAARDTEPRLLSATALAADYLRTQLNRCNSRRQVLILDCCHSGAYARGTKSATGASVGSGTALITAGYGRVVLTASDATQYAWDGEAVQGEAEASVFTRFLVEGLRTGAADLDGDGQISVDELYEYVYGKVLGISSKQTPAKFADKQQGAIYIAKSTRPIVNKALLPPDLLETLTDGRTFIREGAVLELGRIYIGDHPGRAATAEDQLRQLAEKDDSARVRAAARQMLGKRAAAPAEVAVDASVPAVSGGGGALAPAPTGRLAGVDTLWQRCDDWAFRRYRLRAHELVLAVPAVALGYALAFKFGAWAASALPGRAAASTDSFVRQLPFMDMGTPQLALFMGVTLGAAALAGLLAWAYPTLRHRELVAALGPWAAVWLALLAWVPGTMGKPLTAGTVAAIVGGGLAGWTLWGFALTREALRGAAVVAAAALAGWGAWTWYLLSVSDYFGATFAERLAALGWFSIHLILFEPSTRAGSWTLAGFYFGLGAIVGAVVFLRLVRVMLPPPHAFARRD